MYLKYFDPRNWKWVHKCNLTYKIYIFETNTQIYAKWTEVMGITIWFLAQSMMIQEHPHMMTWPSILITLPAPSAYTTARSIRNLNIVE